MWSKNKIFRAILLGLALVTWLFAIRATAQQNTALQDALTDINGAANPAMLYQFAKPNAPSPFARPGGSSQKSSGDTDSGDSLVLEKDSKWTITTAQYVFSADPDFYSAAHQSSASDWDSLITGALNAYVNRSNTSYVRMTGELETYGQKGPTGAALQPGGHSFTMEWEAAHVLPSKLGFLEVAAGRYWQQAVAYPAFANGPISDTLLGYSGVSTGFQTSVTIPDKNLTFSFRHGTQYLGNAAGKAHEEIFQLSWTW